MFQLLAIITLCAIVLIFAVGELAALVGSFASQVPAVLAGVL